MNQQKRTGLALAGVAIVLIVWIVSCAINPVSGKREFMLLTEQDEIAMGQQTDEQIAQTYGIYRDAELEAYIEDLGQRMGKVTHRPNLPYSFKILDTPVVNAFAVPGGYVYFTRGILGYMNNEAELAGVLAHELGHINARHSAQQYSRQTLAQVGLGVGFMLSEKLRQYAGLAQFGVGMLFLSFSRENEREADDLGVDYSMAMDYDANGMATFFETLQRLYPESSASGLPDWFSTHPDPENRVQAVRQRTAATKQQMPGKTFVVNENEYLGKLDGLVFGEDPRQGYVDGNAFYHPTLKFVFPVPTEWNVNNTPAQVQMVSKAQDAAILFTLDDGSSTETSARSFIQQSGATVKQLDAIRINNLAAHRLIADLTSEDQTYGIVSYFIEKEGKVYVFLGYTGQEQFAGYQRTFEQTMSRFSPLTDSKRINVTPNTLSVKKAARSGTARSVLQALGVSESELESTAVMNGFTLDQTIPRGKLVKVVMK
ncbi:M48 family metalloprotease [candidate division KSB1 bacterium]|nr:M48 family metalloprotease [candidate division KSB1 bacterium]